MRHLSNARMTPVQHTTNLFWHDYVANERRKALAKVQAKTLTKEQKAEQKKDRDPQYVFLYIAITVVVVGGAVVAWFVKS